MAIITRSLTTEDELSHAFVNIRIHEFSNTTFLGSYLSLAPVPNVINEIFSTHLIVTSDLVDSFLENINTETVELSLFNNEKHNIVLQDTIETSTITYTHSFRTDLSNETVEESNFVYYLEKLGFIGTTSPITPTAQNNFITLSFEGQPIIIRAPNFGNTDTLSSPRINRKPRGNYPVLMYRSNRWPVFQQLSYSFTFLDQLEATALLNFIRKTLGKEVTLIDYENITWTGIILTPETEIVEENKKGFSVEFDFHGKKA